MTDTQCQPASSEVDDEILVIDIVRYLSALVRLHRAKKTGNIGMSMALSRLADALRPYSDLSMSEAVAAFHAPERDTARKHNSDLGNTVLPDQLESMSLSDVKQVLDEDHTKDEIAEIGARRFGMSRSKLRRLRKEDAREAIRAALAHEVSLDVISREARSGGVARAGVSGKNVALQEARRSTSAKQG
jgi:hypothetical protein